MFVLAEIRDYIRIAPCNFHKPLKDAISEEINKKLANKVVMNVGLSIALWDITELGDSHIIPGDGCFHTRVCFRYVVFRPFLTEILVGKVKSCSREGVVVTLGFFDDIVIPSSALQHPSRFDEAEQVWVWEYQVDDEKHDLFMDIGEPIRFRVTAETFEETSPTGPENTSEGDAVELKVPYSLTASINEPGLGLMSWWANT
ncbi:hypothetical protein RUM43_001740 [Polyplax serrata]|uniref:DNA-directed RNA polymerase III subunit RPC8 n=1 Tax=Polyplax serrata TaxID=468196 RepID=A0AAN8SEB5_POLSC